MSDFIGGFLIGGAVCSILILIISGIDPILTKCASDNNVYRCEYIPTPIK